MADRLTQLQDAVNQMGDHFCNAVGVLQQFAPPGQFGGFEKSGSKPPAVTNDEQALLFAQLIARTAKDIDVLIDSLPSEDSSPQLQLESLRVLEGRNAEAALRLEEVVQRGESLLAQIQQALHDIAQAQLENQAMESELPTQSSSTGSGGGGGTSDVTASGTEGVDSGTQRNT